jgi:endonuclease G
MSFRTPFIIARPIMFDTRPQLERRLDIAAAQDLELEEELASLRLEGQPEAAAAAPLAALEERVRNPRPFAELAEAFRAARPVLSVARRFMSVVGRSREGRTWLNRLLRAYRKVNRAFDAVGRIEVKGNGDLKVAGTGFLVRDDVIATNRHVAEQFAEKVDGKLEFRLNMGGERMEAFIDFREESGVRESREFRITEVLAMDPDVDVAFLRVARRNGRRRLSRPLAFFTDEPDSPSVAAIGYPGKDTREKKAAVMHRIFGDVFDKKRVSPGRISGTRDGLLVHDCSVLAGNSGSPVLCLKTGKVVGIHTTGEFLENNFAVPAAAAEAILRQVPETGAADDDQGASDDDQRAAA